MRSWMALHQRRPKVLHCLCFRALLDDTPGGTSTDLGFAPGIDGCPSTKLNVPNDPYDRSSPLRAY